LTNLSGLRINLFSGADCSGSTGVEAGAVNVHAGAIAQDGLLLVHGGDILTGGTDPGGIVTLDAGNAFTSQDLFIDKAAILRTTNNSVPTRLKSIIMGSAEYFTISSGGDRPMESIS